MNRSDVAEVPLIATVEVKTGVEQVVSPGPNALNVTVPIDVDAVPERVALARIPSPRVVFVEELVEIQTVVAPVARAGAAYMTRGMRASASAPVAWVTRRANGFPSRSAGCGVPAMALEGVLAIDP